MCLRLNYKEKRKCISQNKRTKKMKSKKQARAREIEREMEEGTFKQELLLNLAAIKSFFELLKFFFSFTSTANWIKKTKFDKIQHSIYNICVCASTFHFDLPRSLSLFPSLLLPTPHTTRILSDFFPLLSVVFWLATTMLCRREKKSQKVSFCLHWYGLLGITTMRFINQCELTANIYMRDAQLNGRKQERWRE